VRTCVCVRVRVRACARGPTPRVCGSMLRSLSTFLIRSTSVGARTPSLPISTTLARICAAAFCYLQRGGRWGHVVSFGSRCTSPTSWAKTSTRRDTENENERERGRERRQRKRMPSSVRHWTCVSVHVLALSYSLCVCTSLTHVRCVWVIDCRLRAACCMSIKTWPRSARSSRIRST
jgi:hypothetical protein